MNDGATATVTVGTPSVIDSFNSDHDNKLIGMVLLSFPQFETVEAATTVSSTLSSQCEIYTAKIAQVLESVPEEVATAEKVPTKQCLVSNMPEGFDEVSTDPE